MFYEIISKNGKKNYLFGTIHINDQEVTQLPLEVKKAFCDATKAVFEADILAGDLATQSCIMTLIQTWQAEYHTQEVPPILATQIKLYSALSSRLNNGVDMQLACEAKQRNIPLSFLESISFQMERVIGVEFSLAEQEEYAQYMERWDSIYINDQLDKLKKYYLEGNIDKALQYSTIELEGSPDIIRRYYQAIIFDRDLSMAETMKSHLEEGGAFIGIGAAHLPGVTQKLVEENYIVNLIPLGPRVHPIQGLLKEAPGINVIQALGNFGIFTADSSSNQNDTTPSSSASSPGGFRPHRH
jgi:hypothetical protein